MLNRLDLTLKKAKLLNSFTSEYLRVLNNTALKLPFANTPTELHHETYSDIRKTSFIPSDIIQEARKDVWKMKKLVESRGYIGNIIFSNCTIRLNKRWFKAVASKRGTLCFKITYAPKKTFTIPICKDRQFQRFKSFVENGWGFDNISLLKDGRISVVLEKEFPKPKAAQRCVVGADIGSSTLSAVTLFDTKTSKVVRQLYFGRDVAKRQRLFDIRRAYLKSLSDRGSHRARQHLERLKRSQRNFVKTRSGQIAKEIVIFAKTNNAYIAIEKLRNLRTERGKICKNGRKKINRIPYFQLITFLKSNSEIQIIPLVEINPYHTSKWCSHCGAINKGHQTGNYSLYVCKTCNQIVNSDRKASLAIAVKSVLERNTHNLTDLSSFQISRTRVSVNGLLRSDDVGMKVTV